MKMAKYYNARVRGVAFRTGDFVYRSNDVSHTAAGGKLGPKWEGPYEVTEVLGGYSDVEHLILVPSEFVEGPCTREQTPLILSWDGIPRLDSGVRISRSSSKEEEDLLDNQGTIKGPFKEARTTKTARVKGSALDAVIQIILLENVQSHRETRTKEDSLEDPWSDEISSIDDLALDNEYDKLCKTSLKIITKNKRLKATRNSLEKEIRELKDKLSTLEKNKGVDLECSIFQSLKIENWKT
ncbi:hypothetical protein Tco_1253974 [Tanacetum coccineum]